MQQTTPFLKLVTLVTKTGIDTIQSVLFFHQYNGYPVPSSNSSSALHNPTVSALSLV